MPHRILRPIAAASALSVLLLASPALAQAVWHVAPQGSTIAPSPDGSPGAPFGSVTAALRNPNFKPGDTVLLLDGHHGSLTLRDLRFAVPVTIQSANPGGAHLDWVLFAGTTSGVTLRDVKVWPRDPADPVRVVVNAGSSTARITVDGVEVRSHAASANYRAWTTREDWANRRAGITLGGPDSVIANSTAVGVAAALTTRGHNSQILDNTVRGFAGDGMRALGNNSLVRGNDVADCFKVDSTHMDGFQAWATDGRLVGLTLDGNRILEWTGPEDNPLRCALQGIGLFDGFYQDLRIVNNVVAADANHGITVMGVDGVVVANNTVANVRGKNISGPYIAVFAHKNKTPSRNVVVANNAAMDIRVSTTTQGLEMRNNTKVTFLEATFVNPAAADYRPRKDSGLIDNADPAWAPATDIAGTARPLGKGPDRGAYEMSPARDDQSGGPAEDPVAEDPVVVDPVVENPVVENPVVGGGADAAAGEVAQESGTDAVTAPRQLVPTFPTVTRPESATQATRPPLAVAATTRPVLPLPAGPMPTRN